MKMKNIIMLACGCVLAGNSLAGEPKTVEERLQWWREARFGMFIHWGPVSLKGTEIGWSRGAQIPIAEYDNLYKQFNPTKFDAEAWVTAAKNAGMKYIVLTTKHHDGFCLWDTKLTDHNIMNSPFHRDVVKELSAACKKQGLAFGTYYSTCDWHHPDFPMTSPGGKVKRDKYDLDRYTEYLKGQVKELLTNYGPLSTIWFDVPQQFDQKRGQSVIDFVRSIQPDVLVNNRTGAKGDYDTPEQHVGGFQIDRPWETCMTICNQWAWKPNDPMKPLDQCIRTLVQCAGGDGNLLFNVGPTPEGIIEERQVERLKEMGAWLKENGESVYATRGGPIKPTAQYATTRRDNVVYLHVFTSAPDEVVLPALPKKIKSAVILQGGPVQWKTDGDEWRVSVPAAVRKPIDTVVKVELDGPAMDIAPLGGRSMVKEAKASNVFQKQAEYAPEKAFDGDAGTRWATDSGTHAALIEATLPKVAPLSGVEIDEEFGGRVEAFEFQVEADGQWKTVVKGTKLGKFRQDFPAVTTAKIRLNITKANEGPTISEIRVRTAPIAH